MNHSGSNKGAVKIFPYLFLSGIAMLSSCTKECEKEDKSSDYCSMVITQEDGPTPGTRYVQVTDSTYSNFFEADQMGALNTWDFSKLKNHREEDLSFDAALAGFPSSGLTLNGVVAFSNREAGLEIDGYQGAHSDLDLTVRYDDPMTYLPYSLCMKEGYKDSYSAYSSVLPEKYSLSTDSMRIHFAGINNFLVIGSGIIILPGGSFKCIKYEVTPISFEGEVEAYVDGKWQFYNKLTDDEVKQQITAYQSATYVWVSKDKKFPLCSMTMDDNRKISSVTYLK